MPTSFAGRRGLEGRGWLECKWCLGRCNVTRLLHCGPRGIGCSLLVLKLGDPVLMLLPIIGVREGVAGKRAASTGLTVEIGYNSGIYLLASGNPGLNRSTTNPMGYRDSIRILS